MADLLIIAALYHLTCLEGPDKSSFSISQRHTKLHHGTVSHIVSDDNICLNSQTEGQTQVYTVTHTLCPLFLHKPTQVYCSAPSTPESIDETFFLSPVKGSSMGISVTGRGWEQRWNRTWISVVWGFQHAQAKSQVPVVFCAVFLEVFSGHALRRALFEFHIPKTTFFSCPLENNRQVLHLLVDQK